MEPKELILQKILSDQSLSFHGLIDIDDFSIYNSTFGFEQGNMVLEKIPLYMEKYINPEHWLNIGSDEFLFSIRNKKSEELRNCISNLMQKVMDDLHISISVGLTKADESLPPTELLARLKSNVLTAKRNGKNLMCNL